MQRRWAETIAPVSGRLERSLLPASSCIASPSLTKPVHTELAGIPPLEIGQMRRCRVLGTSIFDLEATPVA